MAVLLLPVVFSSERTVTVGRVEAARLVEKERTVTGGHVVGTGGVEIKHVYTMARVAEVPVVLLKSASYPTQC